MATETWLRPNETVATISDISPPGYSFCHEPRSDPKAGGVGLPVSNHFNLTESQTSSKHFNRCAHGSRNEFGCEGLNDPGQR